MFGGASVNPYDDIVNKTTDENLTSENWELILNLCDKVLDEGQEGAHNVIAAILKRLTHRNPNVQLYALSLAEALSKNCNIELHREIASRAFTQGLEKIITDRTTHDKVKRRALGLIAMWTAEFENDSTLGIMEDCYNNLKAKNYKFEAPQEPPPPTVDDEIRRKEEEELQRVLEMSMQDKGGRGQWQGYSAAESSGAGGSGSSSNLARNSSATATSSRPAPSASQITSTYSQPSYHSGYVPARSPSPKIQASSPVVSTPTANMPAIVPVSASSGIVTRVRALHTFEPTEAGELAFEKGDIIKVVDRGYKDWWRGQLKGRTGIFPVNYVEPMPEPTAAELAREAEQEAAVFAQAVNVEKLLTMLRSLDPAKDNLADNEEIQELYRSSMALRPKIVKLIDKYSQKRADLVSMNETFLRARTIFDRMMEESLARHTAMYDQQSYRPSSYAGPTARPDSRGRARQEYAPSPSAQPQTAYGWSPALYNQTVPGPAYNSFPAHAPAPAGYAAAAPTPDSYAGVNQGYVEPAYAQQPPQGYGAPVYGGQQPGVPYGPQGPTPYPAQTPQQQNQAAQQAQAQIQAQTQPHLQAQVQPQSHLQTQSQAQPQPQQPLPQQAQPQPQSQSQAQPDVTPTPRRQQSGPPYAYDPKGTYADPNVQAWATYYAQGGTDLAGAVYFISIPGLTDKSLAGTGPQQPTQGGGFTGNTQDLSQSPQPTAATPSSLAGYAGPQPAANEYVASGPGTISPNSGGSSPPAWGGAVAAAYGTTPSGVNQLSDRPGSGEYVASAQGYPGLQALPNQFSELRVGDGGSGQKAHGPQAAPSVGAPS